MSSLINFLENSFAYHASRRRYRRSSSLRDQINLRPEPNSPIAAETEASPQEDTSRQIAATFFRRTQPNSLFNPRESNGTPLYQRYLNQEPTSSVNLLRNRIQETAQEASEFLRTASENFETSLNLFINPNPGLNNNEERDIITTVEGFLDALKNGLVKEVADNIIIESPFDLSVSKFEEGYLYNSELQNAWAGNSFNAYSLLVMNQRFYDKFVTGTPIEISNKRTDVFVDPKVIVALQREVGFPTFDAGDISSEGNFIIFDRNQPGGVSDSFGKDNITRINNVAIPTLNAFRDQLKQNLFEYIGADNIKPSKDKAVATLDAVWESIFSDPYSESYLNTNTTAMFADYLGLKAEVISSQNAVNYLANWGFIPQNTTPGSEIEYQYSPELMELNLGSGIGDESIWKSKSHDGVDGKALYSNFILGDLQTYIGDNIQGSGSPETQRKQFPKFYKKVLKGLLKKADKNGLQSDTGLPDVSIEERLRSTLRLYFVQRYNASSLQTQNGKGFANFANPFVDATYDQLFGFDGAEPLGYGSKTGNSYNFNEVYGDTQLHTFMGQEVWIPNVAIGDLDKVINIQGTFNVTPPTPDNLFGELQEQGWFEGDPPQIKDGSDFTKFQNGGNINELSKVYVMTDENKQARAIRFTPGAATGASSDTLSAYNLTIDEPYLTRNTLVNNGDRPWQRIQIGQLDGIVHSEGVLPDQFNTYISLAGGLDRITGSQFIDVIIGPGLDDVSGSLTVDAGAGGDVVAPGRNGSTVILGEGRDKLVIDNGDLFGQTILFDFKFSEDTLILGSGIKASVDDSQPQFLYLYEDGGEHMKTLALSQESDQDWNDYSKYDPSFTLQPLPDSF